MRTLVTRVLPWFLTGLMCGCGEDVQIEAFEVVVVELERCVAHDRGTEVCEEPPAIQYLFSSHLELVNGARATLFVVDPETGTDRAYTGELIDQELHLQRLLSQRDQAQGCVFEVRDELRLARAGLDGNQRIVRDESAGCNGLGITVHERVDLLWRGRRL